jgi:hypothetical protein
LKYWLLQEEAVAELTMQAVAEQGELFIILPFQ